MSCQFDFYSVEAVSKSIRALMKIEGVGRDNIRSTVRYGGRFPETTHSVYLKFYDVYDMGHSAASKACDDFRNTLPDIDKVRYVVKCHIRD